MDCRRLRRVSCVSAKSIRTTGCAREVSGCHALPRGEMKKTRRLPFSELDIYGDGTKPVDREGEGGWGLANDYFSLGILSIVQFVCED